MLGKLYMAFNYQYVDTGNESAVVKIDASSLYTKVDVSTLQANANGDTQALLCYWCKNINFSVYMGCCHQQQN